MAGEEKIVKNPNEDKKEPANIWKATLISLVSVVVITASIVGIYNSDWLINKTLHAKQAKEQQLGKNVTYEYYNKYENNKLKINIAFKNVDEKIMKIANNYMSKDDELIRLVLVDKDGFKLTEVKIPIKDFVHINEDDGQYYSQCTLSIDKPTIRKVERIDVQYMEILDTKYDDIIKKVDSKYKNFVDIFFGL